MKRFSKIFGAIVLVLLIAAPAWPAALTLTNERISSIGNLRMVTGTSSVASGDTYAVPMGTVISVHITARNALGNVNPTVFYNLSGTTITVYTTGLAAGGTSMTYDFMIVGF